MTLGALLDRLEGTWPEKNGNYLARCPAHEDKHPSLSIREVGTRLLARCWAGCETSDIVAALGLTLADLFTDSPMSSRQRVVPPSPPQLNLDDVAFQFELAALDRRMRAERVLGHLQELDGDLTDKERDRLMVLTSRAYEDLEEAGRYEGFSDRIRERAYRERAAA